MNLPFSSVRWLKQHFARKKRVQAALRMLSSSGVLRLSHIELRYR
jgi:hypothetical protein